MFLALLAWLAVSALAAHPASAHAVLLASEPADGQALDEAPGEILLRFSEPVEVPAQAIQVFDAGGERVDLGDAAHGSDTTQVRVSLPDEVADGAYTVSWRAVSADSHPVRGAFTFTVGDPGDAEPVAVEDLAGAGSEVAWQVPAALARWLTYTGALLAAGGAAFLLLVHDRREVETPRLVRIVTLAAVAAVLGTLAVLPLQAVLTTGLGWRSLVSPEALGGVLASGVGSSALVRVAGLTVLVAALPRLSTAAGAAVVSLGAVGALASFLLTGHTAVSEPRALVLTANIVHTASAAFWFGGLVLLALVLRWRAGAPQPEGAHEAAASAGAVLVRRFSGAALVSLLALVAAGTALAWVEVGSWEALVTTAYGYTLLAKVGLVAVVVAVAAYNRRRLVGRVAESGAAGWRRLHTTVRFEAGALVAVLGITAVLVTLVPAGTAAGIGDVYVEYLPLGDDHEVNIVVDPARTGRNEIHLYLLDESGQLAAISEEVTLRLSLPDAGIAPIERTPLAAGPGHWLHTGSELSIRGIWQVEVRVLVSEFERLTTTAEVRIGGRAR